MALELTTDQTGLTGSAIYVSLSRNGQRWNGSTFETVAIANWSTYIVTLTETTGTGFFHADMPAALNTAGPLVVTVYLRAGGSPAATDGVVGTGGGYWLGSAWLDQTGDSFARLGAAGAGLTALGDARLANLDAAVSSRSSHAAADVWGVATRTLSAFGFSVTVGTNNDKNGYSLTTAPPTAAANAAAVWDLATSGHTTAGTFGAAMNAAGSAGDPWSTPLPGSYGAGTAGNVVGTKLDAAVSSRSTYAGGAVASVAAGVTLAADAITTAAIQDGAITSAKFTVAAISGVATGILEKLDQLWRRFFRRSVRAATGLTIKTYADDGTTVVTTQAITDDGAGNESVGAAT